MPLIEPVTCPDIFASGIARVEKLVGGCVRIVFYAEHRLSARQGERIIVAKLVQPISTLIAGDVMLNMALGVLRDQRLQ
jgi:hypothetical protein